MSENRCWRLFSSATVLTRDHQEDTVPERTVVVASKAGLHARPAAMFVKAAAEQQSSVTIRKPDGDPVDASSILAIMTLGVEQGDEVILEADGEHAEESLSNLEALLSRELDE